MEKKEKHGFFKKEDRLDFYTLLTAQCDEACNSSTLLVEFMKSLDNNIALKIESNEKSADHKREELIYYVENTFITPVDRHYLFKVSRVIDDLTDEIKDLKDYILFFNYQPTGKNIEMAELSSKAIYILTDAMKTWKDSDDNKFWENIVQAKKYKNQVKRLYWENIKELEDMDSLKGIITMREFCRDLNNLANKVGKAADRLGDFKIKSIK